jgi:hypothetical protein
MPKKSGCQHNFYGYINVGLTLMSYSRLLLWEVFVDHP